MRHVHPSDYYDASAANLGRVKARWDRDVVLGWPAHSHLGNEWMFSPIVSL